MTTTQAAGVRADPTGPGRWWVYQRERFPLAANGALIAAFSFCAVSLSMMLRGGEGLPAVGSVAAAFVTCLLFFLQLRIADEFKDHDEDARYRPYRPVPRGLVTLRELAWVFAGAAAVQVAVAVWLEPRLLVLLAVVWAYLAAMSQEFGLRSYLKARPVVYVLSHMLIMPLIDLYATGTEWLAAGQGPPAGLAWFLAASFFNGVSIEVGRKTRGPADEEQGVETYSALWGRPAAIGAWWAAVGASMLCALGAARGLGFGGWLAVGYAPLLVLCVVVGLVFLRRPVAGRGNWIEVMTGVWTLGLYLGLGAAPLIARSLA